MDLNVLNRAPCLFNPNAKKMIFDHLKDVQFRILAVMIKFFKNIEAFKDKKKVKKNCW